MTAPVSLSIGGVSFTNLLESDFIIQKVIGKTVGTLQGTLYDKNSALSVPLEGVDVVVTRSDTGARIFGGLSSIITGWTEGRSRYWQINAQNYTVLLDRIMCFASYGAGRSDKSIIQDVFSNKIIGQNGQQGTSSEITTADYVNIGQSAMTTIQFFNMYLREVLELLSGYVGFNYYVDDNLKLHYYLRETQAAPYGLSSSPNGTSTLQYRNLRWKRDATRINNNYVVYGASVTSAAQTDYITGDGSTKILSCAFQGSAVPLYAPAGSSTIQVWVNTGTSGTPVWTSQTVGDDLTKCDVIYDSTKNTLTFNTAPPNITKGTNTGAVKVYYRFPYGAGIASSLPASITKYGRIFSNKLIASDANSAASMMSLITNLKQQFGYALEILTCTVDDAVFPGTTRFEVGQWVNFVNSILGLAGYYQIHSITTKIIGGTLKSYDLELRNWYSE